MTFRTTLLNTVERVRRIPYERFDVRTATVTRRVRTWTGGDSGAEVRLGTSTDDDVELLPRPHVREVNGDQELTVGPITPSCTAGGYTVEQLNPTLTAGQELIYVVVGANGTRTYALASLDTSRAFTYMLRLQGLERATPY